ncbi:MAG: hypothetical protein K5852_10360 [Eubacterium sp.]|nr:hypothetical protein [Eubacterium sp.]
MAKGITGKEPDPREVYRDIIDHPRWESPTRPPMSLYDRAAQFAPFAALSGYDDMIDEEARLVDNRIELSEEELEELNRKLSLIHESIRQGIRPAVTVTYFVPDPLKPGGLYTTVTERVRRVDAANGIIRLDRKVSKTESKAESYMEIQIKDILDIREEP